MLVTFTGFLAVACCGAGGCAPSRRRSRSRSCSPVRLFLFGENNCRFHLLRQLISIPERSPRPITESFQTTLLISPEDFVAGLSRNQFPAQRRHRLAIFE